MQSTQQKVKKVRPFIHHMLKPSISSYSNNDVSLTPQYQGCTVNWIINNGTSQTKYFVIYRGATFPNFTIGPYPFGNAYWVDYAGQIQGQTVSYPITSLNNIQPYSLGMINNSFIAFVFQVPPNSSLTVPEGGFSGATQLMYMLVEVTPDNLYPYIVFWQLQQYFDYVLQTGYSVVPVSYPYVASMYNFKTNVRMNPEFIDPVIKNYFAMLLRR